MREDVIEKIDIKKLASNVSELDVDDAVDVVEDLEESDQETFLRSIPDSERKLMSTFHKTKKGQKGLGVFMDILFRSCEQ